ncbi:Protein HEG-like 1 [Stylophora pistillata]|uniref:Protein HEG-like 1 n=1 Tax=Stylophora pistillata TaxID=50429 RepID=A0A2B4RC77_STYPI|nr:Protein HEG-like 1 [Stylophora pistillata]
MENACVSVNIGPPDKNGLRVCQLSDSDHTQHPSDLKPHEGYLYWASKNSCSSEPCGQSMPCINGFTEKRYICPRCQDGFMGERCEQDINECITNPHGCHHNASCNNTIGSYTCKCKPGLNCTLKAVFTNVNATGRYGPTTLGSHYAGQDHDGQVTLSSGIQLWTVPYTGDYKIEAIGAAGGYDPSSNSTHYRGKGTRMIGTFRLSNGEVIKILCGQEGGINKREWSSGGGGGTFIARGANTPLIIAGGGGGAQSVQSRHGGCDASTQTTGNSWYKSWSGGSNGHGAQDTNDSFSGTGNYLSLGEGEDFMVFRANGREIKCS